MAERLREDVASRMPAANNTPGFRTISDFRKDHLVALLALFLQVLMLCFLEGLVKLGHVALDGIQLRANASKHRAMRRRIGPTVNPTSFYPATSPLCLIICRQ